MKRLEPTLTAILAAAAVILAGTGTAGAVLTGDCLSCVGRTVQQGGRTVEAGQGAWMDACINGSPRRACPIPDTIGTPEDAQTAVDGLIADIEDSCGTLAAQCFEGFCGGADCVGKAHNEAMRMVADAIAGGGNQRGMRQVPPPPPPVTLTPAPKLTCSTQNQPCVAPGKTGCCRGLICKISSFFNAGTGQFFTTALCGADPTCTGPYCGGSPAKAFFDKPASLLE